MLYTWITTPHWLAISTALKHEIRVPKTETIFKIKNSNDQNSVYNFCHSTFELVSNFDIRYSDLILLLVCFYYTKDQMEISIQSG